MTASAAPAQPPNYGHSWATITHPGNRPANQLEAPWAYPPFNTPAMRVGGVDHEFRISTTEVSVAQWFDFVQAYEPYHTGFRADAAFTGQWITPTTLDPDQPAGYHIEHGAENFPTTMSWHFAARFVNWLHNGRAGTHEAFESGVYNTMTFTQNPDGSWNDQATPSVGAQFWIPSLDEWTKAAYYDPARNGAGQDGYWRYPTSSDSPPIPGWPEDGGETSAGLEMPSDGPRYLDVGAYPDTQSPWGLLDLSGSAREWTGTAIDPALGGRAGDRFVRGTATYTPMPEDLDRLDSLWVSGPAQTTLGLRIASAIPSPGSASLFCALLPLAFNRLRRGRPLHEATLMRAVGPHHAHDRRSPGRGPV